MSQPNTPDKRIIDRLQLSPYFRNLAKILCHAKNHKGTVMEKDAKEALQVTKEIVVKFIEAGRISPSNFDQLFPAVYETVLVTITKPASGTKKTPASS